MLTMKKDSMAAKDVSDTLELALEASGLESVNLKIATGALQTATVKSAALLQMDDRTGRIEEGFEADLILVPGNPLTNIEALQDVLLVMSDGRLALKRIPFGVTD